VNIFWSRVFRILSLYAVKIEEENTTEIEHPCIICANHTSYLDIFLMYSVLKEHRFLFMGKSEILDYPLVKTFFKGLNIPVYRNDRLKAAKSFIQAKKSLQQDWSIVIFPEGGIPEETPYLIPFKDGAFKLAKTANVGILPITFQNNYRLFSDPENVFHSAFPGLVKISIHNFIDKANIESKSISEINEIVFECVNRPLPKKA
jgi:1-acyl-sn-glycerol-3-phosphate acyltransferase